MRASPKLPNVPRYTSYPTAPNFSNADAEQARVLLFSNIEPDEPVSVYIHIPFCDRLCWFCGCHTKHTLKYAPIATYVDALVSEIGQFSNQTSMKPKIASLHFGGGSPSMLRPTEAQKIMDALRDTFEFEEKAEISIEVDPNDATSNLYEMTELLGVTRVSLGVQDFNPKVQTAINRIQTFEDTYEMIQRFRDQGIKSLNVDALYGLPFQTEETITKTIEQVLSLEPDRVALFGYAHVPKLKKHQRLIDEAALPDDTQRVAQANIARHMFLDAGYEPIGIDHFAIKDDALARAKYNGSLHRNFQGYTTDTSSTLIGFGASSISSSEHAYVQNTVATGTYMQRVADGQSAAERGFVLSLDDRIRSYIIRRLMCDFQLDMDELARAFPNETKPYEYVIQSVCEEDGGEYCFLEDKVMRMIPEKQDLVRMVASKFDAYLAVGNQTFSKAV